MAQPARTQSPEPPPDEFQEGLPGHTLPLNYEPVYNLVTCRESFPTVAGDSFGIASSGPALVYREILMMRVMNAITDKSEWDRKVFDEAVASKWKDEIAQSGQDISPSMMEYIMRELQWKATLLQEEKMVSAFNLGVVKSDIAIPPDLQQSLKETVAPLENVSEEAKDYHPGSDGKVVNLVHPSLFPVVYGRTRILPEHIIGLDDCVGTMGQGDILPVPDEEEAKIPDERGPSPYSRKFQWLPCNVEFKAGEPGSDCRISSYINNVHPVQHRALYKTIEDIIARTIPLWNRTLTECISAQVRIEYSSVRYEKNTASKPPQDQRAGCHGVFDGRQETREATRRIVQPEPDDFTAFTAPPKDPCDQIDLRRQFSKDGLQVIIKLANIELSPDKPEYEGGTWHIEGQLNEHICASAIYYYDSRNITESNLEFRQRPDTETVSQVDYDQERHEFLQEVFGFGPDVDSQWETQITQDFGSIVCREGRLITFPNVLQHRVSPFSLADRSKPGHRKILALFLVDPHVRIISSANVPPQREDWDVEKWNLVHGLLSKQLPQEVYDMVMEEGIMKPLMSMDEAMQLRLELMEERSVKVEEQNGEFRIGRFRLCEH